MALALRHFIMKTNNLYEKVYSVSNLKTAWEKARKGKTKKSDVAEFERDLEKNLLDLHRELKEMNYKPKPLTTFILRDPKTRVISKSDFRDRVVHHALILVIGTIFENQFIYDSCANQIGKGNLFALKRFDCYKRKVTKNFSCGAFCLKADIKHYFNEVNHDVLIEIIKRKIADEKVIWLIDRILKNCVLEKYDWVDYYLGREWIRKIILTKDKTLVRGKILVDDRPRISGAMKPS